MSKACTKSNQSDDYQRAVAMYWIIKLLENNDIGYIQEESNGIPGEAKKVSVDDVVVVYKNNKRLFIQAKKKQPTHRCWSISDLKDELLKILELQTDPNARVSLYSQTPYSDIRSLADASLEYPDYSLFQLQASDHQKKLLNTLTQYWDIHEEESFQLLRRIDIGSHHSLDELEQWNQQRLAYLMPHAKLAIDVLGKALVRYFLHIYIDKHHDLCTKGLTRSLKLNAKTERLLKIIESSFDVKQKGRYIDPTFACLFIVAVYKKNHIFFEWIADLSNRDPIEALCEKFIQKYFTDGFPNKFWGAKKLIIAFSNILREADETDDEILIN